MTNHTERQGWSDDTICLGLEDEDGEWSAYCSPEATGEVFVDSEQVSTKAGTSTLDKEGAPLPFDIVFHGRQPQDGEVEELAEELGSEFVSQFNAKVDEVYNLIDASDDPLESIMQLGADDIITSKSDE